LKTVLEEGQKHFVDKEFADNKALDMFLHKIHPKQIVLRFSDIPFMFHEVKYQYTTVRGNRKEGVKYFVFNTFSPEVDTKSELERWVVDFNKENPSRQLLNVKFLKSKCLGYSVLSE
jgi:hypothetical protein